MTTLIDSKRLGESRGTGITVRADAFTTTDDGHALIITSPRPILITTPDVENGGANTIAYELYRAQIETTDPDHDAWRLVEEGTVAASGDDTFDYDLNAHAVMLLIKSDDAGQHSEGVVARLTGTA